MFITFEGPDGSGKTTQIRLLDQALQQLGYATLLTREPGGTEIGNQVREVLMRLDNTAMHPRTEILLFQASRSQLVEEVIRPSIARGLVVLCDRYADSTIAYQGYGHRVDLNQLRMLIGFATGGLKPDLTLLLDIDAEEGLRRRESGGDWNRMDAYQREFHQRVRRGYHLMMADEPERWIKIDASLPVEDVSRQINNAVIPRLARH